VGITKLKFDPEVARAAVDELRPICRTVFTLFVWETRNPAEIVAYLAQQGIVRDAIQVMDYVFYAFRHCHHRIADLAPFQGRSGEQPTPPGRGSIKAI
jgi:hypothetical protein